ncbi:MAG: hypothetical protein JJU41_01815 [Bacteroidetes bacterium]|nr:hypothetical protein [Bacteroidota bacterium]MCH8523632.1 hypothetical protein [Balneolales bacterium]
MVYLQIVLVAVLLYTIVYLTLWIRSNGNLSDILILLTAVLYSIFTVFKVYLNINEQAYIIYPWITFAADWIRIGALSFILTGLGLAIRESKPRINRAPAILSFLPFLLLLVHPLIQDTIVIKELLFGLYSVSALIIALLLFTLAYVRERKYGNLLLGTIILLIGFALTYVPSSLFKYGQITGMMFFVMGILSIATHYKKQTNKLRA